MIENNFVQIWLNINKPPIIKFHIYHAIWLLLKPFATPGDAWKVEWTEFWWKLPVCIWSHTTKSLYLPYLSFIRTLIKEFMTDTFRSMSEDLTRHRSHYTVDNFHINGSIIIILPFHFPMRIFLCWIKL